MLCVMLVARAVGCVGVCICLCVCERVYLVTEFSARVAPVLYVILDCASIT